MAKEGERRERPELIEGVHYLTDYYAVLGVSRTDDTDTIKKIFREKIPFIILTNINILLLSFNVKQLLKLECLIKLTNYCLMNKKGLLIQTDW